jgi:hypothetical protein
VLLHFAFGWLMLFILEPETGITTTLIKLHDVGFFAHQMLDTNLVAPEHEHCI